MASDPDLAPADVVVVGLGPAGRALAHRCGVHGLDVVAIDPHPDRRWTPTYAAWSDELPDWVSDSAIACSVPAVSVWTTRQRAIDRAYSVFDTEGLRKSLSLKQARVVAGNAVAVDNHSVTLTDGRVVEGTWVVDARGTAGTPGLAEQTAFGTVVDSRSAEAVLDGSRAWFMDWRADNGADPTDVPSFLYAIPLAPDRVLLEETCLVGKPGLELRVLQQRLTTRLRNRGLVLGADAETERVRFAVQAPPRRRDARAPLTYGSRGGILHPGTGYSVAASLAAADAVASGFTAGRDPDRILWPRRAAAISALRSAGLRTLLSLKPEQIVPFFDAFFDLPVTQQRAYLSSRTDIAGTAAAMLTLYRSLPTGLRRTVTGSSVPIAKYSPIRALSSMIER